MKKPTRNGSNRKQLGVFRQRWKARVRLFEPLEVRHLMASDLSVEPWSDASLGEQSIAETWVPESRPVSLSPVSTARALSSDSIAAILAGQSNQFLQGGQEKSTFRITDVKTDRELGATYVYLQETFQQQDIVNAYASLTILANGEVVNGYSSFVSTSQDSLTTLHYAAISPSRAIESLARSFSWPVGTVVERSVFRDSKPERFLDAPSIAKSPVTYDMVYVPTEKGHLELAWRMNVRSAVSEAWLDASVSAVDGRILFVADWNSDAQYNVIALPKTSPSEGPRSLVTDVDPNSPFGWHDVNGIRGAEYTITRGNNAYAYRDTNADNQPDPNSSPNGGTSLNFNPPFDVRQTPTVNANAGTVNLFYMTNRMHDIFNTKGFDAAAGNFQVNNGGAGGVGNDPVLAEGQDPARANNASMATPPDGQSPRLQVGIFSNTNSTRDASFDNTILAHEFGHGITNRLTGGPANATALVAKQSDGMGEGWSDYFALAVTQKETDTALQGRAIGTYAKGQPLDGLGLRRQKYSYDMAIDSLVFGDIRLFFGQPFEPHSAGEVWASTLWDLHWALIGGNALDPMLPNAGLGFDANLESSNGGNNLALRLVVEALKLQPANPTFLQGRDAILAADRLLTGGKYQATIWTVFARRGMGADAIGDSANTTQVTNGFKIPIQDSIPFERKGLLGSGISSVDAFLVPINDPSQIETLHFVAESSSKTSFVVTPSNASALVRLKILRPDGTTAVGPIAASIPGGSVSIPSWQADTSGDFKLQVVSSLPSNLRLEAARNAAVERQVGDSTNANPLVIDPSFRGMGGGGLNAVVGGIEHSYLVQHLSNTTSFVDISQTGTPLNLGIDESAVIQTTIGNALLPAGSILVSNNGGILAGTTGSIPSRVRPILNLPDSPLGLFPYWDAFAANRGNVFWEERSIGRIPALIVQWNDRALVPVNGTGTFQIQLFASGPVLARFSYQTLAYQGFTDNGGSASIGFVSPTEKYEVSYRRPIIQEGDAIEIRRTSDLDVFKFSGVVGSRIDVALDAIGINDLPNTTMTLINSQGTVLATATSSPLAANRKVGNYDLGILGFPLPASGDYSIRVTSTEHYAYYLAVGEDIVLDTENATPPITPIRNLGGSRLMVGNVQSTDSRDVDEVQLAAGQSLQLSLSLPDDFHGIVPANTLAPRLSVLRPDGTTGATTVQFDAGGRMVLNYTALETGTHSIDVRAIGGSGDYMVKVQITDPAAQASVSSERLPGLAVASRSSILDPLAISQRSSGSSNGALIDQALLDMPFFFDTNGDGASRRRSSRIFR